MASNRAATCGRIAFDDRKSVSCPRRHSTTTIGTLQKTNSVSLCVPDARGRNLKKAQHVSQVQNEVG
jgi:hypothetical protein